MYQLRRKKSYAFARPRHKGRRWMLLLLLSVLVLSGGAIVTFNWYKDGIAPVNEKNVEEILVEVPDGTTEVEVSSQLEEKGIIRSALAYRLYLRFNGIEGKMQAGAYALSPSMSVSDIVTIFSEGKTAVKLVTILPGQRLDQVRDAFIKSGYSEDEVDQALEPTQYAGHPALADKPQNASLEGYLYPESYQKTPSTPVEDIVKLALDETARQFTPQIIADLKIRSGLNMHQAIIVASIVEKEVSNPDDRLKVAQVFLKRLEIGMQLGSDVTAFYGAVIRGLEPSVLVDTPYNTRMYGGLPPGPISNVSGNAIQAVAYPASTDFLFFVSGDDGKTYFSKTVDEHEALAAKYCIKLCGR